MTSYILTTIKRSMKMNHASFPIGKSIRACLAICTTFSFGLLSDHPLESIFACIAALCFSVGENSDLSYRAMLKHTLIATLIGGIGIFSGIFVGLPWIAIISIMFAVSFLAVVVSNQGMSYSVGAMIALLMSSIIVGMPIKEDSLKLYLSFQAGTVFYLFLLGCQAFLDFHYPERQLLAKHIKNLATIAKDMAQREENNLDLKKFRDNLLKSYFSLHDAFLNRKRTYSSLENHRVSVLHILDRISSYLTLTRDETTLLNASMWLEKIAYNTAHRKKTAPKTPPFFSKDVPLFVEIEKLAEILWEKNSKHMNKTPDILMIRVKNKKHEKHEKQKSFIFNKDEMIEAFIFATCMATAFSMKYLVKENHWFWIPLSIALTMKPDFGSVFTRIIARSLGTILGAIIGTIILFTLPKSLILVVFIGFLAFLIPWAKGVSYATQVSVITAILLILLDLLNTSPLTIDYATQRIADTIIAGAIIIFFSYLVWPKSQHEEIEKKFNLLIKSLDEYLEKSCQEDNGDEKHYAKIQNEFFRAKTKTYQHLLNLKTFVNYLALEPKPARTEAKKWFPPMDFVETICEKISSYFIQRKLGDSVPNKNDISSLHVKLKQLEHSKYEKSTPHFEHQNTEQSLNFLTTLNDEFDELTEALKKTIS